MSNTPMAATQLSQTPVTAPTPATVDAVNGNITPNSGATIFELKNTDTATHTVTFDTIVTDDGLDLANLVITVPASSTVMVSGLPPSVFGSNVQWLASSATYITAAVIEPG